MVFSDILTKTTELISPEFDKLLEQAWQNQPHKADLLLFQINGFYDRNALLYNQRNLDRPLNPHVIGPGSEGHSERTHYDFIDQYRMKNILDISHEQYLQEVNWAPDKQEEINKIVEVERMTIHLEMLIYLKIWETDLFIKKLYQFVRALDGEHYDWRFKICESNRDKDCTGTREKIIRNLIRDKIEKHSPVLFQFLQETYKTQVRNSIAHSKYSFTGLHSRHIHLNNFIEADPASQLHGISFDEWVVIFHNTLTLYNEYIRINNIISLHYSKIAEINNNELEILVTEEDMQYVLPVVYIPEWKRWTYKTAGEA